MSARIRFWIVTAAAVAAVLVTVSLGRWQLARAAQKEALQAAVDGSAGLAVVDTRQLLSTRDLGSLTHRRAALRGQWISSRIIYLDNRPMQGRAGFFVLTPLKLSGSDAVILVQRGWVARDFTDRTRLAPVSTPDGEVEIHGRLAATPSRLYELGEGGTGVIRQNLDLASFRAETRLPLLTAVLVQSGPASEGLLREWPAFDAGVDKHLGYAAQWFGLAALLIILYVWFQFIQPRRAARQSGR